MNGSNLTIWVKGSGDVDRQGVLEDLSEDADGWKEGRGNRRAKFERTQWVNQWRLTPDFEGLQLGPQK